MNKTYIIAASTAAIAIISVVLFIGQMGSFQKKIDELSNMNVYDYRGDRVGIFESTITWEKWPAWIQAICYETYLTNVNCEVKQATSWTAFKSLLKTEDYIVGSIFYDRNARVIWFDFIRWEYPGSHKGTLITCVIPV